MRSGAGVAFEPAFTSRRPRADSASMSPMRAPPQTAQQSGRDAGGTQRRSDSALTSRPFCERVAHAPRDTVHSRPPPFGRRSRLGPGRGNGGTQRRSAWRHGDPFAIAPRPRRGHSARHSAFPPPASDGAAGSGQAAATVGPSAAACHSAREDRGGTVNKGLARDRKPLETEAQRNDRRAPLVVRQPPPPSDPRSYANPSSRVTALAGRSSRQWRGGP